MAPIVGPLAALAAKVALRPPRLPLISNVTGTWMTAEQATNSHYWASQAQHTVRFAPGLEQVFADPEQVLLEVGPGTLLTTLARSHPARASAQAVVPSLRPADDRQSDLAFLLNAVGELWLHSIPIDWLAFHANERRQRVSLPTYPFERKRYWTGSAIPRSAAVAHPRPSSETKLPITEWLSAPAWRRSRLPVPYRPGDLSILGRHWIVFVGGTAFDEALVARLRCEAGLRVVTVVPGDDFRALGSAVFAINPEDEAQYRALLDHVTAEFGPVDVVAHLWLHRRFPTVHENDGETQRLGFYSLLALVKALGRDSGAMSVWVVTSNAQAVADTNDRLDIGKATLLGLASVVPQEYGAIRCRSLDFSDAGLLADEASDERLTQLLSELADPSGEAEVAYRGRQRWVLAPEPLHSSYPSVSLLLRRNGVYLITGGLGHIGSCIGEYLARTCRATLVLTSRSGLPAEHLWSEWIATHEGDDPVRQRILRVRRLRDLGADVIIRVVDVADRETMARLIAELRPSSGGLHGVIHAAGVVDSGHLRFIEETTPRLASEALRPHVAGTMILDEVLQDCPIDFCALISSLSSLVGGLTYGAHAAGHRFMDAVAQARARRSPGGPRWITINYDTWRVDSRDQHRLGSGAAHLNLTAEEGVEVFARSLSLGGGQVLVSTTALSDRIAQARRSFDRVSSTPLNVLPSQAQPASAASDPVEIDDLVRQTFQAVLGLPKVHPNDNFFALGGASLLFLDVISRLDRALGIRIPLVEAFRALSAIDLAALCARCVGARAAGTIGARR
jgi:acyl transferase domain-containing protein/acyl carrier protein